MMIRYSLDLVHLLQVVPQNKIILDKLDILKDDAKCEKIFKTIVDYIVSKGEEIDIENRKSFERKETTDYLLQRQDEIVEYLKNNGVQLDQT